MNGQIVPIVNYQVITDGITKSIESDEIIASEILTEQQFSDIRRYVLKINVVLRNFFQRRNLELMGFSVQFGQLNGKIIVCSDFTLDTCDLKDAESRTKFKKSYLISHIDEALKLYECAHEKIIF